MSNNWFRQKRKSLIIEFGGKCQDCGKTEEDFIDRLISDKLVSLEFAHKVGTRFKLGKSRGQNKRIGEIIKNKQNFLLLCKECHVKYDMENPLNEAESNSFDDEVPF